jgi:uncharacterized protein YigE (DUF2233 family)
MPSKKIFPIICASLILAGCLAGTLPDPRHSDNSGQAVTLQEMKIEGKNFLVATIDPTYYQLQIVENSPPPDSKSIKDIHDEHSSVLSFNGSFFDPDFHPLGLLISDGKLIFPLNKSDLMNGIMTIDQKGSPQLLSYQDFQDRQTGLLPTLAFAIQSGPILIDRTGKIIADKQNKILAGRTALGLDKDSNLVMIMLRQSLLDHENALTLYDFANLVNSSKELAPLGITSLINLDGGNSSGLAFRDEYYPELEKVQNVIITLKRTDA